MGRGGWRNEVEKRKIERGGGERSNGRARERGNVEKGRREVERGGSKNRF